MSGEVSAPAILTGWQFDFIVFIGRFQPFHYGHLAQVKHALRQSQGVILYVGSSNRIRSQRNFLTYKEREAMIRAVLLEELGDDASRVIIMALPDRMYDTAAWIDQTRTLTAVATSEFVSPRTGLGGHDRDASSAYLHAFPEWSFAGAGEHLGINATSLREAFLTPACNLGQWFPNVAPPATLRFLQSFRDNDAYVELMADRSTIMEMRKKWGMGPFLAADAIVVQNEDILTIRRGNRPNKGAVAVPGGLLEPGETLLDCAIRELFEETGMDKDGITKRDMLAALRCYDSFDDPHRSDRYSIVSQGFLFVLPPDRCHPKVLANRYVDAAKTELNDAVAPSFGPLAAIRNEQMFEDHGFMISRLLKQAKLTERTF